MRNVDKGNRKGRIGEERGKEDEINVIKSSCKTAAGQLPADHQEISLCRCSSWFCPKGRKVTEFCLSFYCFTYLFTKKGVSV